MVHLVACLLVQTGRLFVLVANVLEKVGQTVTAVGQTLVHALKRVLGEQVVEVLFHLRFGLPVGRVGATDWTLIRTTRWLRIEINFFQTNRKEEI